MLRLPHQYTRWYLSVAYARRYSTSPVANVDSVTIPCSAGGRITIDIYRPRASRATEEHPIILYLPRGPISTSDNQAPITDALLASYLSRTASATTVQVNYRLSPNTRYPSPIYDTLAAYDWILSNLLPKTPPQHPPPPHNQSQHDYGYSRYAPPRLQQARLGVYGELVGGSLAMMLALTECKTVGERARIAAAAVKDAVVDWTAFAAATPSLLPSETAKKSRRKVSLSRAMDSDTGDVAPSHAQLHNTLTTSFPASNPSSYFSPFASPIHFLRTPASTVPSSPKSPSTSLDTNASDFDILAALEADDLASRHPPPPTTPSAAEFESAGVTTRRKVPLRWPPSGLAPMAMPDLFVRVGGKGVLREQNEDMVRVLRRAWLKYGDAALAGSHGAEGAGDMFVDGIIAGEEGRDGEEERREELRRAAEAKVLLEIEGDGSDGGKQEREIERIGEWFARVLR